LAQAQTPPAAPPAEQPAQPPAGQAPAPAPQPQDVFKFSTEAGGWIWQVKPDQTAAFEGAWKEIRSKLATAERPDLKELGASLKMYRISGDPAQPQAPVTYLFVADPASKTLSYAPSPFLLFESKLFDDATGRKLFDTLNSSTAGGISPMNLNPVPAQ
jgi:hypothetical protein